MDPTIVEEPVRFSKIHMSKVEANVFGAKTALISVQICVSGISHLLEFFTYEISGAKRHFAQKISFVAP